MNTSAIAAVLVGAFTVGGTAAFYDAKVERADNLRAANVRAYEAELATANKALAEATKPRFLATKVASKNAAWNAGIDAGLAYWSGKDGHTRRVVIIKGRNYCGDNAIGCATQPGDGTCIVWLRSDVLKDRFSTLTVAVHETGHCVGRPHVEGDLVMSP